MSKQIGDLMKILVTGANGFIGSSVVEGALERGHEVWGGMRSTSSKRDLVESVLKISGDGLGKIGFITLDYENPELLTKQLIEFYQQSGAFDVVIHVAGVTNCPHTQDFYKGNTETTRNLIYAIRNSGMTGIRFIYISSLGTFGPIKEHQPFGKIVDSDTQMPLSEYGKSKLAAERIIMETPDLDYIILRPTAVYGPRDKDLLKLVKSVRFRLDAIAGLGAQAITFVYVKDLVQAIMQAAENRNVTRKAYFVSDGHTYSSSDFSRQVATAMNHKWTIHLKIPIWLVYLVSVISEFFAKLFGHGTTLNRDKFLILKQRNWQCDIQPIKDDLGYQPKYSLKEGVSDTVNWYKSRSWL